MYLRFLIYEAIFYFNLSIFFFSFVGRITIINKQSWKSAL